MSTPSGIGLPYCGRLIAVCHFSFLLAQLLPETKEGEIQKNDTPLGIFVVLLLLGLVLGYLGYWFIGNPEVASGANVRASQLAGLDSLENVTQIAAGRVHTCALNTSGEVFCWGDNSYGELGDGTRTERLIPTKVSALENGVQAIATGDHHTCALTGASRVKCWGLNYRGQLGDGTTKWLSNEPVDVIGIDNDVIAITANWDHTCALTNTGTVKCWGWNGLGQLGDGTLQDRNTATEVSGLEDNIVAINAGPIHTCAVTAAGHGKCWGTNSYGQLGNGTKDDSRTPVDILGIGDNIRSISVGWSFSCAITTDNSLKCWGYNDYGQLGNGTFDSTVSPVGVVGMNGGVSLISAGLYHICASTNSGSMQCWGRNNRGQLGNNTTDGKRIPTNVIGMGSDVFALATGNHHTCAILVDKKANCWGSNSHGQLGNGTKGIASVPTNILYLANGSTGITANGWHTCLLPNAGGIKCWGSNGFGQLGDNTEANRSVPVSVVGISSPVSSVIAGGLHTCALSNDGKVQCWGYNRYGQLGDGTVVSEPPYGRSHPADVTGLTTGVHSVSTGDLFTCALTISGEVKCWGSNYYGQLGDGTNTQRNEPVAVLDLQGGVIAIKASSNHTCALLNTGTVMCWGWNANGQLGDGTAGEATNKSSPVKVIGLDGAVKELAIGYRHSCALMISGGVKCWGDNGSGQLGDGTWIEKSTPTDVVGLEKGVTAIATNGWHTCALTSAKGVKCWGANDYGQLGNGSLTNSNIPVTVVGLNQDVDALTTGKDHSCAVLVDGVVKCWGDNSDGQLGNDMAWSAIPVNLLNDATPTPTHTSTSTSTPTSTPTPTPLSQVEDSYEHDDTCTQPNTIPLDGMPQRHTFHDAGDEDWVVFDAIAGKTYRIEAGLPADSPADVVLELYDTCSGSNLDGFDKSFTPAVRLDFKSPTTGSIYLRLLNNDAGVFGPSVAYDLSIRPLNDTPEVGAAILVAGREKYGDNLQPNIHSVISRAYALFVDHKYTNDDLMVIATDSSLPGYGRAATLANLEWAITQWAPQHLSPGDPFTIYMMSHGKRDTFYLDGPGNQLVTPAMLDGWLDQLQAAVPNLKVNVIIEACQSGSFIFNSQRIAGSGRVIITSSDKNTDAYASDVGAYFSDYFIVALHGSHLYSSFLRARENVAQHNSIQKPQLEANGNGVPNEDGDYVIASTRGFGFPGTFGDPWPPYIAQAQGPTAITNRRGIIRAEVRDDSSVRTVWAVVYPPSYRPPDTSGELVPEPLTKILLSRQNDGWYAGEYAGFDEAGTYRIVIQATDNKDLSARPVVVLVENGDKVFLPFLTR